MVSPSRPVPGTDSCPCGSGVPYERCCEPLHRRDSPAATATELMRARYSAYVRGDDDFLLWSWHPDHRPAGDAVTGAEHWTGLEIVTAARGGAEDDTGTVEFIARFRSNGTAHSLHEVSRFVRLDGRWVYLKDRDVSLGAAGRG